MNARLRKSSSGGKLILRLGIGALMLPHGLAKLGLLIDGNYHRFPDPFGLGSLTSIILVIFAELVCSILIMIGYKTRWATIPPIITMLIAIFLIHLHDDFSQKELPVIYLIGYISIAAMEPGLFSIDQKIDQK